MISSWIIWHWGKRTSTIQEAVIENWSFSSLILQSFLFCHLFPLLLDIQAKKTSGVSYPNSYLLWKVWGFLLIYFSPLCFLNIGPTLLMPQVWPAGVTGKARLCLSELFTSFTYFLSQHITSTLKFFIDVVFINCFSNVSNKAPQIFKCGPHYITAFAYKYPDYKTKKLRNDSSHTRISVSERPTELANTTGGLLKKNVKNMFNS